MGDRVVRLAYDLVAHGPKVMWRDHHPRVLLVGLGSAGKTTIFDKMRAANDSLMGSYKFVRVSWNIHFIVYDVNDHQYECKGLVFVLDSADREHFEEAKKELNQILECPNLAGVPLVVFANKQDLPNAASPPEVEACLGLRERSERAWHVQGTSGVSGDGIEEGLRELHSLVRSSKHFKRETTGP